MPQKLARPPLRDAAAGLDTCSRAGCSDALSMEREDVSFESFGATLSGWLYRSTRPGERPAVVMTHGLSAVKEMFLDDYASRFRDAGFTTLVYDHYGFGASEGEPRQSPDADIQLQGYRDAVSWLAEQGSVDPGRIGVWGSSYSGGHVIVLAAQDLPIACAVAQVPHLGKGGPDIPAGALEIMGRALESGDPLATVPAVSRTADGEGVMYQDGAHEWFTATAAARAPSWRNELRVSGVLGGADHVPLEHLANTRVPMLLVVATQDRLTPALPAIEVADQQRLVRIVEVPGGHFSAYGQGFDQSSGAAVAWFGEHLGS